MIRVLFLAGLVILCKSSFAQLPCSKPEYRQFDFWLGDWEAYAVNGKKAGDSKISIILDSCVILEEWTSTGMVQQLRFAGKSFNTYNASSQQWQQTWVDNTGGNTEYLQGKADKNKMVFLTAPFKTTGDTLAIRRLSFYSLAPDKVRQLGEISKDKGKGWITEYDLEYRRKK